MTRQRKHFLFWHTFAYIPMILMAMAAGVMEMTGTNQPSWFLLLLIPVCVCWMVGILKRESKVDELPPVPANVGGGS